MLSDFVEVLYRGRTERVGPGLLALVLPIDGVNPARVPLRSLRRTSVALPRHAAVASLSFLGRENRVENQVATEPAKTGEPQRLKDALRRARIDAAERTGVVVDLHDAEVARLELLNEALDPVFAEIPSEIELFDRGLSRGETPRLWIDAIAHVAMGRDKRIYRFLQDTRYGRKVLAESVMIPEIAEAVTNYIAQRMIERERALTESGTPIVGARRAVRLARRRRALRALRMFVLGLVVGVAILVGLALLFPGAH